jgi:hypothetical protein
MEVTKRDCSSSGRNSLFFTMFSCQEQDHLLIALFIQAAGQTVMKGGQAGYEPDLIRQI